MSKFIIGMGLPASGKTVVLKRFADKYGYEYISTDELRKEMFGKIEYEVAPLKQEEWKKKNDKVWDEARKRLREMILGGDTVVFDAIFNNSDLRKEFIDIARQAGVEKVQGIYIDISEEASKRRNLERDRRVPEQIIEKISNDFKESGPKLNDGFDGIFTLDEYQNLVSAEKKHEEGEINKEFRHR
jgi:predicted kinase